MLFHILANRSRLGPRFAHEARVQGAQRPCRGTLSGGQVTGCPRKTLFSSFSRRRRRRVMSKLSCHRSNHHNQNKMKKHRNAKPPRHNQNPPLIIHKRLRTRISQRSPLSRNQPHSNTQAQRRTYRRTTKFSEKRTMTTFTQRPGTTRLRHPFWLDKRNSFKPDATCTNRTLYTRSFLWPSRVFLLRGNGGRTTMHDIFHSRQSFPSSCFPMFYFCTLKRYTPYAYPFALILPQFL